MSGYDEFIKLFGNTTLLSVAELSLTAVFLWKIFKKIETYLYQRYKAKEKRDKDLSEALTAVRKYSEFRAESDKIHSLLEGEIQELRKIQEETTARLEQMEENNRRRERNKTRDRLLQLYRHYTDPEINPSQTWTSLEAEIFWNLFDDYEHDGGNGRMHSEVAPAMRKLREVDK